jgi:hypothetical protein
MSEVFLTPLEKKLLDEGYSSFSLTDKNSLIAILANKVGVKYSDITDEYIFNYHKQLKIDILSDNCDEKIIAGFTSANGHKYRTNRDDQINMIGKMIQLMNNTSIVEVNWKTEDAGYVKHTREEWITVFNEGLAHKEQNLFHYNTLKAQVHSAQTDAEVVAVKFE